MPATLTETKDPDSILLGLGVLGMASYAASPTVYADVGYLKGVAFKYTRELKEFTSAGLLVKRLVFRDRFELNAQFAEVSIANLNRVFQPQSPGTTKILFGGQKNITTYSLRFEHTRSDGKIVQVDMFKTAPSGEFTLGFDEENFITYPVNFVGEADTTKTSGQQLGKIQIGS